MLYHSIGFIYISYTCKPNASLALRPRCKVNWFAPRARGGAESDTYAQTNRTACGAARTTRRSSQNSTSLRAAGTSVLIIFTRCLSLNVIVYNPSQPERRHKAGVSTYMCINIYIYCCLDRYKFISCTIHVRVYIRASSPYTTCTIVSDACAVRRSIRRLSARTLNPVHPRTPQYM